MRTHFFLFLVASTMTPQIVCWSFWSSGENETDVEVTASVEKDIKMTSTTTEFTWNDPYDDDDYPRRKRKSSKKPKWRSTTRTTLQSTSIQSIPDTTTTPTSSSTTTTTPKVPSSLSTATKPIVVVSNIEETTAKSVPASILQDKITTTTTTNLPLKAVAPTDDGEKDIKFSLVENFIKESQERLKDFQLELSRSELEIAYVILVNLQSKLSPLQTNLSSLLFYHDCRTSYWIPSTSSRPAGPENDPKSCPTSPQMTEDQIIEFESMLEVNQQFHGDVHSLQNTVNDDLQQLHQRYVKALHYGAENEPDTMDLGHQTTLLDEPLPPPPPSVDLEAKKSSINNDNNNNDEKHQIVLSPPSPKNQKDSFVQQNLINPLSQQIMEIESLPQSSSPTKITKFKTLITQVKAKGLEQNPDLFRLASSIKNTRYRSDAAALKPEFPKIVQELIWSEKLSLLVKKDEKIFKLCVNRSDELVTKQVTPSVEDKEDYGQFWRFSPLFRADYFLLYNAFRRVLVGAGQFLNSTTGDPSDSVTSGDNVGVLTKNVVGLDLTFTPQMYMWKVQLSCPKWKKNCDDDDDSYLISIMNAKYPNFALDLDSLGNVVVSQTTVGHFSVLPSQYPIIRKIDTT